MPRQAFGQALAANRPHLIPKGCLTPFIPLSEYTERRESLFNRMAPNSVAIFPGNQTQFASPSVFYPFRQDPNLEYLSGFKEPDACLVLRKGAQNESFIFANEKDPRAEMWEGDRTGTELIPSIFGVSAAYPSAPASIRARILELLAGTELLYFDEEPKTTRRQGAFFHHEMRGLAAKRQVKSASDLVAPLRLVKSENEIDCMRVAAEVSAAAYNAAYKLPFASEHELHAYLDFMFRRGGCDSDAYLAVVAGGAHALTIHYVRNDDLLRPGELVLVDAGGRYGGYCADISRTWPVNGRFSPAQRDLYEAVLSVEKQVIAEATTTSGNSLYDLHRLSVQLMQRELANVGLKLSFAQVQQVYPHSIGHNLGMDVHDGPGSDKPLLANQVITVEPGVYIPATDQYPKHFHNIGIRIEDNVVVGATNEVLTEDCCKEVDEIER